MKLNAIKRAIIKFVSFLIFPVKIYGKENLPKGSAVICCNHFSIVDCIYLVKLNIKENYSILSKKEALKPKVFGSILKGYGAVPIDRQNPELRTLMEIIKGLKNGNKLLVFPEGTRNKTKTITLQPLKGGSAVFSVRAKCPIVPVMILKKAKPFCRNKMIVGKPFELSEFYDKKNNDNDYVEMEKIIYDKMVEEQNNLLKLIKNESINRKK